MADETARIIKRKRIKLPDGSTCDIPVISQITFADPLDRGQDTQFTLDNSTDSDRDVHVASIIGGGQTDETGNGGPSGDPKQTLQVERVDLFRVLDAPDRGQEGFHAPDSKTVAQPPDAPPYFTTHAKTHIVKYIARNDDDTEDSSIWIKSELIDHWSFVDAPERGQETQWTLSNPPDNQDIPGLRLGSETDDSDNTITTISVDPSVEEITTGVGGSDDGDKPVRTDPFQNIVDFVSHRPIWSWTDGYAGGAIDGATQPFLQIYVENGGSTELATDVDGSIFGIPGLIYNPGCLAWTDAIPRIKPGSPIPTAPTDILAPNGAPPGKRYRDPAPPDNLFVVNVNPPTNWAFVELLSHPNSTPLHQEHHPVGKLWTWFWPMENLVPEHPTSGFP